ncbi:MAG: EAL domain-containing protein [Alkalispirochaeta sp.]
MESSLFTEAIEVVSEAVLLLDPDGRLRYANSSACELLRRDSDSLVGRNIAELCEPEYWEELAVALSKVIASSPVVVARDPIFGAQLNKNAAVELTALQHGAAILLVRRESISPGHTPPSLADQDPVTGLLSRRSLPLIVEQELSRARRTGNPPIALLFVMLRDFKQINQMHGHRVGDLLLENSGLRIRETVRKSDFVFRWEGTNLVVLLPDLATRLDAILVAEKLHSAVTIPYRFRGLDLAPGCHVGIAIFPDDTIDADELFNCANSAVIEAEQQDQPFLYYDYLTHQKASDRLTLKTGLQRAFERNELELYYQPIVRRDHSVAGAEALMRWNHPTRGILGPASFIELAEDSRLIGPIDKLALYGACRQLHAMQDTPDLFLTLNVSATNLADPAFPSIVSQAIRDTGLADPTRLKLELTESGTGEHRDRFVAVMTEIQSLGVEIWIDDFGTGQSSLSYLKYLPVSTVKIDKDFVTELGTDASDIDYLRGIVETVRSRGKPVVIEGVGTEAQLHLVSDLNVEYLQGFYFARPMPAEDLMHFIVDHR